MKFKQLTLGLLSIILIFGLTSCFDISTNPDPDPDPDPTCVVQDLVDLAYTSLENTMYTYTEPNALEPDRPSDIDFSDPQQLFQDAYDCDPTNLDARMGLALTDLLAVMMDSEVNAAFDLWDAYLSANTPFETDPVKSGGRPLGLNLGLPSGPNALELPYEIVTYTVMANMKTMLTGEEPMLSGIQDLLLDVLMPKVVNVIALMTPVVADPDYTFMVSGRMQGDDLEGDIEVDQSDLLIMLATSRLMVGAIAAAVSYDIDFPSYDGVGIETALNQTTGNFLTLRTGVSSDMGNIPGLFLDAFDDIEDAANAMLAETDNQDDDLIPVGPDHVSTSDLNELLNDILPQARALFSTGGQVFTGDFDGDWLTPDQDLTIDLHAFFSTPITDWKAMVPPYNVTSEVRPCGWNWEFENEYFYGTADIDIPEFVNGDIYLNWGAPIQDGMIQDVWDTEGWIPSFDAYCAAAAAVILAEWQADPMWRGEGMIMFWANGSVTESTTQAMDIYGSLEKQTIDMFMYIPVLTFTAVDFDTWMSQIPDASFNGLLPEMTTGQDIIDFFALENPEEWDPILYIEWFDCGGLDNGPVYPNPE